MIGNNYLMVRKLVSHLFRPVKVKEWSLVAVLKRLENRVKGEGPSGRVFSLISSLSPLHEIGKRHSFFVIHTTGDLPTFDPLERDSL
jgi:hypothetical protein